MKVAFLSPELASEVRKLVRRDRLRGHTQIQNHRKKRIARGNDSTRVRYAKTNETITARSGNTLGSGEVSVYENVSGVLTDTGVDIDLYNFGQNTVASGVWVQYGLDSEGEWTLTAVDCEVA